MERWQNDCDWGKPTYSDKNLSACHSVHHKSHMDWPGIDGIAEFVKWFIFYLPACRLREVCCPQTEGCNKRHQTDNNAKLEVQKSYFNSVVNTNLQHCLDKLEKWLKRWHMKADDNLSTDITFSLKRETCYIKCTTYPTDRNCQIPRHPPRPQADTAKTHIYRKKTAWIATPPRVLDHRKKVKAVTGK